MFKKLTTTTLLIFLLASLAACGGKSKKKKVDNLGTDDDKSQTQNDNNNDNTQKLTFLDKELAGIASRLKMKDGVEIFQVKRNSNLQIIHFPAIKDSRSPLDQEERWYYRNSKGYYNNVAFRIYPKADQDNLSSFEFEPSPVLERDTPESQVNRLEFNSTDMKITIKCGEAVELYEEADYAGSTGIAYYPLNPNDESYNHFESPCKIYTQSELENGIDYGAQNESAGVDTEGNEADDQNTTTETEDEGEECIDEETEVVSKCAEEEVKTSCNETQFMRYHVKLTCRNKVRFNQVVSSHCSQAITPVGIVTESSNEISCQSTCSETSCSSTGVDVEAETATDVDPVKMAAAGQLSQLELLPYCYKNAKQRRFLDKSDQINELEEELSALVDYCAYRPSLGQHCEAKEMHKIHKQIEERRKDQARIISKCIEDRNKDAAKGNYSQPEINTCGFYSRGRLKTHRKFLNKHQASLEHENALCNTGGDCDKKKIEKLESKIDHRKHKIEKLEIKCNVR